MDIAEKIGKIKDYKNDVAKRCYEIQKIKKRLLNEHLPQECFNGDDIKVINDDVIVFDNIYLKHNECDSFTFKTPHLMKSDEELKEMFMNINNMNKIG